MVASKDLPIGDTDFDEPRRRAERRELEAKKRELRFVKDDVDDELPGPRRGGKGAGKPRAVFDSQDDWEEPEDDWEEDDDESFASLAEPVEDLDGSEDADDACGGVHDDWRPGSGRRSIYPSSGHEELEDDLD